ncbi:MAG: hypothetical protein R3B13_12175 [Polyangiaceae bacterium]
MVRRSFAWFLACFVPVLWADFAQASHAEVNATTDAQFYTYASPFGQPTVRRRRYTQTLSLHVYDIVGDGAPQGPDLSFKMRLRMDSDFGQLDAERDPNSQGRYVPGLEQAPLDVMYAYLEGNNYLGGLMGFRLGRQYVMDSLGFWSFDGGLVRLTTPVHLQAEAYGGFEQRGGLPAMLGTSRYSADGVYRGNRDDLELGFYPHYLEESQLAPAYGFALESSGLHFLSARVSYRKVINRDAVVSSPFRGPDGSLLIVGGDRVSSERLGSSLRLSEPSLGALRGSVVYDFYNQVISDYAAALDWYTTDAITLGADYDYYYPTFDGDSIWNWFTHSGMTSAQGRAEFRPSRTWDVAASGGVRLFETEGDSGTYRAQSEAGVDPDRSQTGRLSDVVGSLSGRYRWADGGVELRGMGETGRRGHRVGGDATTRQSFDGRYDGMVILSLYDWDDALRPSRDATSFSYVLGAGYAPVTRTRVGVEWEHALNRLVGQRYRVLATLDFTVLD